MFLFNVKPEINDFVLWKKFESIFGLSFNFYSRKVVTRLKGNTEKYVLKIILFFSLKADEINLLDNLQKSKLFYSFNWPHGLWLVLCTEWLLALCQKILVSHSFRLIRMISHYATFIQISIKTAIAFSFLELIVAFTGI